MAINEATEWQSLNDRQQAQALATAELSTTYGMFDQSTGANGAHYATAASNPFVKEGLKCSNCIFFDEINKQCQVVSGIIEEDAVCKLWIIPENAITTDGTNSPTKSSDKLASWVEQNLLKTKP